MGFLESFGEFRWLKKTEFFPNYRPPTEWTKQKSLCLATKSRSLGDALVLTPLARRLKIRYPELSLFTYPRGFNPVVFKNNPAISGVSYFPKAVYGDDINLGKGHLIQLKERFFDLPISTRVQPEIYLSEAEKSWAEKFVSAYRLQKNDGKPLCVIHPWGTTRSHVASQDFWDGLVSKWGEKFRFWQVGVDGHRAVPGCEYYLLLPRVFRAARKLFAILNRADIFLGVDSGPMHVARSFSVPSLIFLDHWEGNVESIFKLRETYPYFLFGNWKYSVLYCENTHVTQVESNPESLKVMNSFLEKAAQGLDRRPIRHIDN